MGLVNIFKKSFLIFLFIILILTTFPSISAENYYADLTIEVDDSGFVTIDGNTNYPGLLELDNQNYTSKIKEDWFLNFSKDEIFSEFIFKLLLPPSSSIYTVNSSGTVWIAEESNRLVIYGLGQNESLSLNIKYQISKSSENNDNSFLSITNIVFLIIISVIIILIFFNIYSSYNKKYKPDEGSVEKIKGITERQQKIMQLLNESSKPLTQTSIEKLLNMPKAAVSRNIHSLERKGLIEIEKAGMSNFIHLKKL